MPTIRPSDLNPSADEPAADETSEGKPQLPADVEARLLAVLRAPLREELGHAERHHAKERDVHDALAMLTPLEALIIQRRIEGDAPDDPVAQQFNRMIVERRARLVAWLVEIRRRGSRSVP
jgi:hypothetical protein